MYVRVRFEDQQQALNEVPLFFAQRSGVVFQVVVVVPELTRNDLQSRIITLSANLHDSLIKLKRTDLLRQKAPRHFGQSYPIVLINLHTPAYGAAKGGIRPAGDCTFAEQAEH